MSAIAGMFGWMVAIYCISRLVMGIVRSDLTWKLWYTRAAIVVVSSCGIFLLALFISLQAPSSPEGIKVRFGPPPNNRQQQSMPPPIKIDPQEQQKTQK